MRVENFLNLRKETDTQVQEAQRVTNRHNPQRTTLRHAVIKTAKIEEKKNIKSTNGKATSYKQGNCHIVIS